MNTSRTNYAKWVVVRRWASAGLLVMVLGVISLTCISVWGAVKTMSFLETSCDREDDCHKN